MYVQACLQTKGLNAYTAQSADQRTSWWLVGRFRLLRYYKLLRSPSSRQPLGASHFPTDATFLACLHQQVCPTIVLAETCATHTYESHYLVSTMLWDNVMQ
jgi:hypothetical protein